MTNKFDGQFECFGENKEKYNTFSVPINKEVIKISNDGNESVESISYKIKFIDSSKFFASLLSNLVDNLTEGIHKIKSRACGCSLEFESVVERIV